jgi:hypothetical protein
LKGFPVVAIFGQMEFNSFWFVARSGNALSGCASPSAVLIDFFVGDTMHRDKKTEVEDYQDYLLRRYFLCDLARSDPDSAGNALKARLDTNAGILDPVYWGGPPPVDTHWDLERLHFNFRLVIPTILCNRSSVLPDLPISGGNYDDWSLGTTLPFPPELVEGITLRDLVFLKHSFGLSGNDRYVKWADVYYTINSEFQAKLDPAKHNVNWLRNELPSEIPIAPLFLASAEAFLIRKKNRHSISEIRRINQDVLPCFDRQAEPFFQALELFQKAVKKSPIECTPPIERYVGSSLAQTGLSVTISTVLDGITDSMLRKRIEEAIETGEIKSTMELHLSDILVLIRMVVEAELQACKSVPDLWVKEVHTPNAALNAHVEDLQQVIYEIIDSVYSFVKKKWRTRGAMVLTLDLFSFLWDIETEDSKVRAARSN